MSETVKDIRIVLVSDNHGDRKSLQFLKETYADYDYFIHLGDSDLPLSEMEGFLCVAGNHDIQYQGQVPDYRVLELNGHRIYICHGHMDFFSYYHYGPMVMHAKAHNCDTVFFGHVHTYHDTELDGVRLLNPGSVFHNRDGTSPTYMLITVKEKGLVVQGVTYKAKTPTRREGWLFRLLNRISGVSD